MPYTTICRNCNVMRGVKENGKVFNCDTCDRQIGYVHSCDTCGLKTYCRRDARCRFGDWKQHQNTHYWVKEGVRETDDMMSLTTDDLIVPKVTSHLPDNPPWKKMSEVYDDRLYGVKMKLDLPPKSLFGYFDYPIGEEKSRLLETVRKYKDEPWMVRYVNKYPECFCPTHNADTVYHTVFDKELHEHFYFDNGNYARHFDSMPLKPVYKKVVSIVRDFLDPPDKELVLNSGYSSLTIMSSREVVGFDLIGLDDGNFMLTYRYKDDDDKSVRYHIKSGLDVKVVDVGTELVFRSDYRLSDPAEITVKKTGHVIDDMIYLDYDDKEYRFHGEDLVESYSSWNEEVGDKYPHEVYWSGIYTKVTQ